MHKDFFTALAAGAASAVLTAAALFGGAAAAGLFGYVLALPILLVGFAKGPRAGGLAALAAAALIGMTGPGAAVVFAAIYAFPAWIAVRVGLLAQTVRTDAGEARVWTSPGIVVTVLTLLAAVSLLTAFAMFSGGDTSLTEKAEAAVQFSVNMLGAQSVFPARHIETLALLFPGLAAASWVMMICFNTALAVLILDRSGMSLRPSPRYAALTLPDFMSWPLVGAAALALMAGGDAGFVFLNLTLVLAVPFFFQGLAVVHTLARRMPMSGLLLGVFYVLMIFIHWVTAAAAALGMLEQWAGVRRRFAGPGNTDDEETA